MQNTKDHDVEVNEFEINDLIATAQGEIDDPSDGRIFRGGYLYGYSSDEGRTQDVYDYLNSILTYKEYNDRSTGCGCGKNEYDHFSIWAESLN